MSRARRWVTLAGVSRPPRTDLLLALGLAALCLLQVTVVHPIASPAVGVLVALATTLPVAWRRTHPVAAALAGSLAWVIPTDGYLFLGYVIAFLLYYSLAAHVGPSRTVIAVAALGVALSIASAAVRSEITGEYFGALPAVVLPAAVGRVVRRLREQTEQLAELTVHLERERERAEHAAVAEERGRIARELHDVVAHGVERDRDPGRRRGGRARPRPGARAGAAARRSARSAKEALEEMRRLLDVLREDGDGGELAPQPGLGQLGELVEHARGAGVDVTLAVDGRAAAVAPGLDLSAYRIVQEGLTNVRKHAAGAPARVRVTWAPRELALEVRRRRSRPPGRRRRAAPAATASSACASACACTAASCTRGPVTGGGFAVRARLPLEERP